MSTGDFTHIDEKHRPKMVDITDKKASLRMAHARSFLLLPKIISETITKDGELNSKKGSVFNTAIIAGTMAVKNTSTLIPFCHPLIIDGIKIDITLSLPNRIQIDCIVKITGKTGVEMEALTGASIAALTIYDMCKALSHEIVIEATSLISKTGGKRNIQEGLLCE